jgi:hypothetical protein
MQTSYDTSEIGESYIRAWHALLALFAIGLAVSGYTHFGIHGYIVGPNFWWSGLPLIVGGAFGLVILPAIVIIPWRLIQRRIGRITNGPIVGGLMAFALVATFSLVGASFDSNDSVAASEARFSPEGCEFSVAFPSQPSVRTMEAVGGVKYVQAEHPSGISYLRAECVPWAMDETQMMQTLRTQAVTDGLSNWSVGMVQGTVAELRGYKQIGGIPATYVVRMYRGMRSVLVIVVAAPSDKYPTPTTSRFVESVLP